jgi:hypothetical protein
MRSSSRYQTTARADKYSGPLEANELQCAVDGIISGQEIEAWAELIEGSPSIESESEMESRLSEVIFQLSTPDINEPVTIEKCWRLLKQLR